MKEKIVFAILKTLGIVASAMFIMQGQDVKAIWILCLFILVLEGIE